VAHTGTISAAAPTPTSIVHKFGGLRAVLAGTPGRLRVVGIAAVVVCLLFGFAATGSMTQRSGAISNARSHAAQLVRIQSIRSNLTQADAAATNAFLVGGLEPADQRTSYRDGIAGATATIASASAGSTADAVVLAKTNQLLAQYTGLIESARANNRQGFPIGAAYLRQASNLLRLQVLPPLSQLVSADETRITSAYNNAAQANDGLIVTLVLALLVLVIVQIWLSVKTRRTLNMGLATATAIVALGGLVGVAAMTFAEHSATDVRGGSLANTVALATARTDAFDGKSAESLTLINRGSGQPFEAHYQAVITEANAALEGITDHALSNAPIAELDTYESAHRLVRAQDDGGDWDTAVRLATSNDAHGTKVAFAAFDATSRPALNSQATHVSNGLNSARRPLVAVAVLLLLAGLASAVLAWRGIAARLREYR
jgi:hypothetical protein